MPKTSTPKAKRPSGAEANRRAGRRNVMLGILDSDLDIICRAAEKEGRKRTQFILHYALMAAKKNLGILQD